MRLFKLLKHGKTRSIFSPRKTHIVQSTVIQDSVDAIQSNIVKRVGYIILNRPNSYNALTLEMIEIIHETFDSMMDDPYITCIALRSSSNNFCSGLDYQRLYSEVIVNENRRNIISCKNLDFHREYFRRYYQLLYKLHKCQKAVISFIPGLCMDGSLSLAKIANGMLLREPVCSFPQVQMGFFPHSATCKLCAEIPKNIGKYYALTGDNIKPYELLYYKVLPGAITSSMEDHFERLETLSHDPNITRNEPTELFSFIQSLVMATGFEFCDLDYLCEQVSDTFSNNDIETIFYVVRKLCKNSIDYPDFWIPCYQKLLSACPLSLKVTLKYLNMAKDMSLKESLELDYIITLNFIKHLDFYRGLYGKFFSAKPKIKWSTPYLDEITNEMVDKFFQLPEGETRLQL